MKFVAIFIYPNIMIEQGVRDSNDIAYLHACVDSGFMSAEEYSHIRCVHPENLEPTKIQDYEGQIFFTMPNNFV